MKREREEGKHQQTTSTTFILHFPHHHSHYHHLLLLTTPIVIVVPIIPSPPSSSSSSSSSSPSTSFPSSSFPSSSSSLSPISQKKMTSSLGLPGPFGSNPSDVALNRRWNEFLDIHNLRAILQTSPAQIDQQHADALAALRVTQEQRAANEAYVLSIWDQIDLIVDYLPPDVNPEWRAQEQLLKHTALRLAARRSRLQADMELCEIHWEPNVLTLDMAPKGKGASWKKIEVATSLIKTSYYLGHEPGDPIFSYCPLPLTAPNDERNFTYRGCVPRDPREDMLRLQLLLPKVVAHVVALLAFSPDNVSDFPEKCWELMDRTDDLGSGDNEYGGLLSEIRTLWTDKFSGQDSMVLAAYMDFLQGHPLVGEAAWLVCGLCRGGLDTKCPEKKRRLRGLWYGLRPLMDVLTFDKDENRTTSGGLETVVQMYVRDQGRKAHDVVFRDGEYDRALLYHEDAVRKVCTKSPSFCPSLASSSSSSSLSSL
ncbi:hypothetical protein CTA2_3607 [Colletotrichum tanaceti]|nr:hypothetical protein CTA2_3607 [Colletotrichum tanaceti]